MKKHLKSLIFVVILTIIFGYAIDKLLIRLITSDLIPLGWWRINLYGLYGLIIVAPIVWLFLRFQKKEKISLGWKKFSWSEFRLVIYAIALIYPVFFIGRLLVPDFDFWFARLQGIGGWSTLGFFTLSTLFFVFKEEIIIRYIQARLERAYGILMSVLFISILFSIFHYSSSYGEYNWSIVVSVFFVSLVIALVYAKTKNIWLTIILHSLINGISALQIYLHSAGLIWAERVFWSVYGLAFAVLSVASYKCFRDILLNKGKPTIPKQAVFSWILFIIICVVIPIVLILL
ncbi:CPBP family intramembrane metalloprotease [Patescibacteria group bacterium]|nr:CPBP family intramembrane metalloprotease [Patescibacteria group bacterium]MBU1890216.1 CPBP family intramembrane metalloprotease [Patescibacteria group bacterium]